MKDHELQAGKKLDKIMKDSVEDMEWEITNLEEVIKLLSKRKVQLQVAIGIAVSSITSVLSVLLCQLLVQ